jgi:hypothetical protein
MSQFYVRARGVAFCAAIVLIAANLSSAATIVLDPPSAVKLDTLLVDGATYTVGDKLFSDFTYHTTGSEMPTADNVNVIAIQDDDGNFGIRLQGGWIDLPGGGASDALVTFNVTALDPALIISDAHLAANVALNGAGLASVTETFIPLYDNILVVFDTPGAANLTDSAVFDVPVKTLPVQKDIQLLSLGNYLNGDFAIMSFVDQTFSQIDDPNQNEIAEPATISMVGLVSMFLGAIYMRRRLG